MEITLTASIWTCAMRMIADKLGRAPLPVPLRFMHLNSDYKDCLTAEDVEAGAYWLASLEEADFIWFVVGGDRGLGVDPMIGAYAANEVLDDLFVQLGGVFGADLSGGGR